MDSAGINRRIDGLGRIVIPKDIRAKFGIREYTQLEMFIKDDTIVLKKYIPEENLEDRLKDFEACFDEMKYGMKTDKVKAIETHIKELKKILKSGGG